MNEDTEIEAEPDIDSLMENLPTVDLETTEDEAVQGEISQLLAPANATDKPTIDNLADAFIRMPDGRVLFLVQPGQRVIIERVTNLIGDGKLRWLDTETYLVVSVNQATGDLVLNNTNLRCAARSNFITGLERGYRFKIPGSAGNVGKRRRGRPRKIRLDAEPRTTPEQPVVKRGRGRPKGSKNRDKSIIAQEKAERNVKRAEKRQKREQRLRKRLVRG